MTFLRVENLYKAFGGVQAVDGCGFSAKEGQITSLIGPNGAGKTTVFNLISGTLQVDDGEIFFRDLDITHSSPARRAQLGISRTFQEARLFRNLNLEENLLLALRNNDHKLLRMWARGFGADEDELRIVREKMTFVGLEKSPKTPVADLSYGQQKLFDLARALLNTHSLLMLDEPVAGVNPVLRDRLKGILSDLRAEGETILLIEHDMDFVRSVADHVVVLDRGRVLAQGKPNVVLRDDRVLDAYLGAAG